MVVLVWYRWCLRGEEGTHAVRQGTSEALGGQERLQETEVAGARGEVQRGVAVLVGVVEKLCALQQHPRLSPTPAPRYPASA